nr:efflux RND transporter periplasmic adaptor subunit [Ammonifex thiophilus]
MLVAGGVGGWLWYRQKSQTKVEFLTALVALADLVATVPATGTIEPVQSLDLSFKNPGTIKVVAVEQGQEVKKGQLLLAQDDSDQQAQLASAEANLRSARARLAELESGNRPEEIAQAQAEEEAARINRDTALRQLERVKTLFSQGAATQKELDDAQNNFAAAQARWRQAQSNLALKKAGPRKEEIDQAREAVKIAEAQVAQARSNLEATRLYAPFDGIVAEVNATPGQRVTGVTVSGAGTGTRPLLTLISKELRVRAQVNEADVGQVKVGQKATFTVNAFPGRVFEAEVSAITPRANTVANVQLYDVLLDIKGEASGLKAGMTCNVEIITQKREGVLAIPRQALNFARSYLATQKISFTSERAASVPAQNQGVVLVYHNGKAEPRPIALGISSGDRVEVTRGLNQGELVIVGRKGDNTGRPATASPFLPMGPPQGGGRR